MATAFYFYVDNWTIFNQYSTNFHWFNRELVEKMAVLTFGSFDSASFNTEIGLVSKTTKFSTNFDSVGEKFWLFWR